jgi:hypothetical protein
MPASDLKFLATVHSESFPMSLAQSALLNRLRIKFLRADLFLADQSGRAV